MIYTWQGGDGDIGSQQFEVPAKSWHTHVGPQSEETREAQHDQSDSDPLGGAVPRWKETANGIGGLENVVSEAANHMIATILLNSQISKNLNQSQINFFDL